MRPSSHRQQPNISLRGLVSLALAASLAGAGVPAPAFAEALDELGGAAPVAEQAVGESTGEQPAEAVEPGAEVEAPAQEGEGDSSLDQGETGEKNEPAETVEPTEQGEKDVEPVDATTEDTAAERRVGTLSVAPSALSAAPAAEEPAATQALAENAFLLIQDSKDKDSTYSYVSGAVSAGAVLWANMYEPSGYYGADVVPAEDGWSYQWLQSSEKSGSASDFTPIDGETGQSLTVTDGMAGTYIAVRVTVDGSVHYGPRTSSTYTDINMNYLPGPVMRAGMAELYKVALSNMSPSVGDTLTATAYTDYSTVAGEDVDVTYTWQQGDSRYGDFTDIEGAGNGPTLTLTADQQGKYVKVIANAGVNEVNAATSDAVMAEGAIKLSGVELEEPDSLQMPVTLTAKAYTGSSYNPTYVENDKVTYTWKYAKTDSPSYGTEWTTIDGETGPTLTVNDAQYAGCCFTVSAGAGANTVELSSHSAVGPVKLEGQVDIYSVVIENPKDGTSVFCVGDTAVAKAREKGAPSGTYVEPSLLNFQWQAADTKSGGYEDVEGGTSDTLVLDESLEGKYLRCEVSSKVGSSSYTRAVNLPVAAPGSLNVTSVKLDKSGKVNVGDTLTATATAAGEDVTGSERVTWSWYYGDSSYATDTKIEGATGSTLEVTKDLLGKYVEARADGGFGEEDSTAVGPVVEPGSVELCQVTVSGDVRVGSTLTATAYKGDAYTEVSDTDKVSYQWQYADSKTTQDSAFADIPGATSATYVITADMQGKYLRVRVTSDGSVVSTEKPYYGSTQSVDPLGPVTLAGQYTLTAVELESSGQAGQAGNVITPTAMVKGAYYGDDPAPSDAQLMFTWQVCGEDGSWSDLSGVPYDASTGKLALADSLVGKTLRVSASALDNTVTSSSFVVLAAGTYDLLRVTTSPLISGSTTQLFTGDAVTATVQAKRLDGSTTNGDTVTDSVSVQWYASGEKDGPFELIDGAEAAELSITSDLAGTYLKAVATSGSSRVEIVSANPVVDANSLAGIVAKLEDENWRLVPTYGTDTNANEVLLAKLADMGVEDVTVRTAAVEVANPNERAILGVSTDDATNGAITYFFMDPDDLTGWSGFTTYQTLTPTFEFSRGGETVTFTPERTTTMPWDEARVTEMLEADAAEALSIAYAEGDAAESVTQDVTLPLELADKSWSEVSWTSSNEDVITVTGYAWDDTNTGTVARPSVDTQVTLTASVGITTSGAPETTVDVPFTLTVKADPEAVEQAKAELQAKVDAAFTADALTYVADGASADPAAVTGDLQLPRPSAVGVDGKYFSLSYAASTDALEVNGYRANAYRPLPGADPATAKLTLTVTSKDNPEVSASKTIELAVAPLEAADIEAELALMDEAKAGYAAAILDGQDADGVTGGLSTFQKAYRAEDGSLAWARDYATAGAAGDGIVTDDLEPDDEMGVVPGHWFKSSNATVVAHDTLNVTQPDYDTEVTITSSLSSEKYARYAGRYANDAAWGEKLTLLAGQEVSATFTVAGTKGAVDPNVSASVSVIGVDAFGEDEVWAAATPYELPAGSTAADLTEAMLAATGLTADHGVGPYGWFLNSITSPDGRVLGWDEATGRYWQLFVNGEAASTGAGGVTLQPGDEVVWYYSTDGASLDDAGKAKVTVTAQVIGPDAAGEDSSWVGLTQVSLPQGSTAADLTERVLDAAGLEADTGTGSYGWFLNSITSPVTGEVLGTVETEPGVWSYWQLFVNGEVSDLGAGSVELGPGDEVVWYYSSYGESLPTNDVEVNPDAWAERPSDWEAEWDGPDSGALSGVPTPTEGGELAWSVELGSNIDASVYASDPIIVNGRAYVAVGDELRAYDAASGEVLASARLATAINSVARMVYTDGLIVVPLGGGRLQVLTADTLTTVSLSEPLAEGQQALSALTVSGGYAYFGTTNSSGTEGSYACVNLRTGAVVWSTRDAGNYWTGGVFAGGRLVTVDSAGVVRVRDARTGEAVGALELGGTVRAQLVADPSDPSTLYAVTNDGTLHRVSVAADGSLAETGSVRFAASSTSTPTIVGSRAYVGGATEGFTGVLAIIDLSGMTVERAVTGFASGATLPGDVKSTPTVSVRDDETYVYFTCNAPGGAAYLYRLGDGYARVLYQPEAAQSNYTMASVVAGADGALYYVNDSGHLFRLEPGAALPDPGPAEPGGDADVTPGGGSGGTGGGVATGGASIGALTGNGAAPVGATSGDADCAAETDSAPEEGELLAGFSSSELGGEAGASSGGAADGATAVVTSAPADMPVWPLVGMGVGAAALVGLAVTHLRGRGGEPRDGQEDGR